MHLPSTSTALLFALLPLMGLVDASLCTAETLILPKVEVSTRVPIKKVDDFRLLQARVAAAAAACGDYVYTVGGMGGLGGLLDTVERFDIRTGKSEVFAKLKQPRFYHRAVIADGKLYVMGGQGTGIATQVQATRDSFGNYEAPNAAFQNDDRMGRFNLLNSVEIVDLATGKVSVSAPMTTAKSEFGCVVYDGKIFVIGGKRLYGNQTSRTNTVEIFDIRTGKWSEGSPMPTPRESDAVLVEGGFIVVAGGYDGRFEHTEVEAMNPRTGNWARVAPLCHPVSSQSVVFSGHSLFLFGSYKAPGELIAYDLLTKQSEVFTLQYRPARHTAAVMHQGRIYVIGGKEQPYSDPLDYIQVFMPMEKR
jgi:hypothetical protein